MRRLPGSVSEELDVEGQRGISWPLELPFPGVSRFAPQGKEMSQCFSVSMPRTGGSATFDWLDFCSHATGTSCYWVNALIMAGSRNPINSSVMAGRSKFTGFMFLSMIAVAA